MYQNQDFLSKATNFIFKHKILFIVFFVTIFLLAVYGIYLNQEKTNNLKKSEIKQFYLSVKTDPSTAKIYLNNEEKGSGKVKLYLPKGKYEILISEQNYIDKKEIIDLYKDTEIEISLEKIQEVAKEVSSVPVSINESQYIKITPISESSFLAIDPREQSLVKVTDEKFVTVLYPKSVFSYQKGKNYIAVLERKIEQNDQIVLININTGAVKKLKGSELLTPISSISISEDNENLYVIGSYTPQTKMSILYKSNLDDFKPSQILMTEANQVFALKDSIVALVEIGEALDSGEVQVIDLDKNQILFESKQNSFSVSPDRKKVCSISSNGITIYDIETNKSQQIKFPKTGLIGIWKDNNIIIFMENTTTGTEYFYLDTRSGQTSPRIKISGTENSGVTYIQGIVENNIYIIDFEGKTKKVKIQ
ncbi:MAG: PEGA domain-containing protein [Patescibacteria group bacterium]|nr:PEGA domain-containing protein [Patescibacteria group bacterium]